MKRNAFTLVELLVVIGIIALLISILLPVLGKARAAGVKADCLSRLRQIATGSALYTNDSSGFLFPSTFNVNLPPNPQIGLRIHDILQSYLPRSEDKSVWTCGEVTTKFNLEYKQTYGANRGAHRYMEFPDGANIPVEYRKLVKVTAIRRSAEVLSVADSSLASGVFTAAGWLDYTDEFSYRPDPNPLLDTTLAGESVDTLRGWSSNSDGPGNNYHLRYRHDNNQVGNAVFLDGHAESVRQGQLLLKNIATTY
ncbi:MAG: type II secretion system protein [Phycisphaerae bacterium]